MYKYLILLVILLWPATTLADDTIYCKDGDTRPRCLFKFDDKGKVITQDGIAERTFNFPPLKVGFIVDVNLTGFSFPKEMINTVLPYGAIQVVDWWMFNEEFNINFGASWGRLFVDYHWAIIPIIDIGPSIWYGYNFIDKEWAGGIGFSILKF